MKIKNVSASVWAEPTGAVALVRLDLDELLNLPELPAKRDEQVLQQREALRKALAKKIEEALKGLTL